MIAIFLFRRDLLIQKESFRIILGVSVGLFLAGLLLQFAEMGRSSTSGALLVPLLTLGLFRFSRRLFVKRFKHEPRDTFLNWKTGLAVDRVFDLAYFMLAIFLLMVLPVGMENLAKAGW